MKFIITLVMVVLTSSVFAQESLENALKKWVNIGSNNIGVFSLRAVGLNHHESLFKDKNGEYQWWMRLDYKKPKGKATYKIMYGYFSCDKSEISFDEAVEYTKNGLVVDTFGVKGGDRQSIPNTPDSIAERSLGFVCSTRFDT